RRSGVSMLLVIVVHRVLTRLRRESKPPYVWATALPLRPGLHEQWETKERRIVFRERAQTSGDLIRAALADEALAHRFGGGLVEGHPEESLFFAPEHEHEVGIDLGFAESRFAKHLMQTAAQAKMLAAQFA